MGQVARPGGLFAIFRIIQYMPYIAIGFLVIMIVLWVVFRIKKLRWAKTMAIILTVLVVITGLLSFAPNIIGTIMGRQLPGGGFPGNGDIPEGDREQFRDFRERQENESSGLDIDIYRPSVDFTDEAVVT